MLMLLDQEPQLELQHFYFCNVLNFFIKNVKKVFSDNSLYRHHKYSYFSTENGTNYNPQVTNILNKQWHKQHKKGATTRQYLLLHYVTPMRIKVTSLKIKSHTILLSLPIKN